MVENDATIYLQNIAFEEGRLRSCRVHNPWGIRVGCCCDHEGCCGAGRPDGDINDLA